MMDILRFAGRQGAGAGPAAPAPESSAGASDISAAPGSPRVVHVMTVPLSLAFLRGQVSYMRTRGFSVHAITAPGPELTDFGATEQVSVEGIPMRRAIAPLGDLVALVRLCRALRRIRPEIVHSHTPKGGLLGMIAASLVRTPVRIYNLHGLRFVTESGLRRQLLRLTERISCALAHRVLSVSHSIRTVAIDEGLCPPGKVKVILGGSINGVDGDQFRPQEPAVRLAARATHGVPEDALVVGFVGRLVRDKGIAELAAAWAQLRERDPRRHLLLVGWDEMEAELAATSSALRSDPRVHFTGPQADTVPLYAAMDVAVLPTYREGFPTVVLEAAAMSLPSVATSVPGCVDAALDGVTGTLVPPRDAEALVVALERYLSDPSLRDRHGQAGRRHVLEHYRREAIWEGVAREYQELLASR